MTTQKLAAEFFGTALLLIAIVGSGIMAQSLFDDDIGSALLANSIATGCMLFAIISVFGPISGAHFNPAVSVVFFLHRQLSAKLLFAYLLCQIAGGVIGVWITHLMFDISVIQTSTTIHRTGSDQWLAEVVATLGLLLVIFGGLRSKPDAIPALVAVYITGAYWFTASTSFANPAVTIARGFTDTFAGIYPGHIFGFIVAQLIAVIIAATGFRFLLAEEPLRK